MEKQETTVVNENEDYIKAIQELKANTVSKEQYNKLKEQNQQLLDAVINGNGVEGVKEEPKLEASSEYKKRLDNELSNLDYITTTLNYRDAVLAEGGKDIFTIPNADGDVSEDQLESARRTADVLKQVVEDADGNNAMFNVLLQERLVDPVALLRRKK